MATSGQPGQVYIAGLWFPLSHIPPTGILFDVTDYVEHLTYTYSTVMIVIVHISTTEVFIRKFFVYVPEKDLYG